MPSAGRVLFREGERIGENVEMAPTVCLCAKTLYWPSGGGLRWIFLNWALGLRQLGCRVIWLELASPDIPVGEELANVAALKTQLEPYGLADCVALASWTDQPLAAEVSRSALNLDCASEADVLLNFEYEMPAGVVSCFRTSVLVDIDPGLLQIWIRKRAIAVAPHDLYFTIGEAIGQPASGVPDTGLAWHYTPPCVALQWWPMTAVPSNAPFTTLANWWASAWIGDDDRVESKAGGFTPFLDLPRRTAERLELAVNMGSDDELLVRSEKSVLRRHGWTVREASSVSSTPGEYQRYVQQSRGEFSCAKPAYVALQNAWISDRTICYLASGKPAIVQHTGPSRFLPDAAGLFRFRTLDEASACLEAVAADYDRQCRLARSLAEEYFDAQKVVRRVLERALD